MSAAYATELVRTHVVPDVWRMACFHEGERVSSWRVVNDYYSATWSPGEEFIVDGVLLWDGYEEMIMLSVPHTVHTKASTLCVSLPSTNHVTNPNDLWDEDYR